jgi:hypothetical protein
MARGVQVFGAAIKRPPVRSLEDRGAERAQKRQCTAQQISAPTPQKDTPGRAFAGRTSATSHSAQRSRTSGSAAAWPAGRNSDQGRAGDSLGGNGQGFVFQPPARPDKENDLPLNLPGSARKGSSASLLPQDFVFHGRSDKEPALPPTLPGASLAFIPRGLLDPEQLRVAKDFEHKHQ